ncbi:MAG: rhomboid family intramembrane serine protease [Acidobacteriota bacterium]
MTRRTKGTPGTIALMGLILAGFVTEIATGAWTDPRTLAYLGAMVPELILEQGQYWRLLSAVFLHGDGSIQGTLLHLGVNLFSLFNIGRVYEIMFGTRRMVLIFFATGIAASITSMLHNVGWSVGASGAVFGVLGALVSSILRHPHFRRDRMARSIMKQCVFWIFVNIAIGLQIPQIDNAAHIGGLVAGLLLGALLPHRVNPPSPTEFVVDVTPHDPPTI